MDKKNNLIKNVIFFIFSLVFLALVLLLFKNNQNKILSLYYSFFKKFPKVEEIVQRMENNLITEIKKEVNLPPPLRAKIESPQSYLTVAGIIKYTNLQRQNNGLPPLIENSLLNQSAYAKVNDMFTKQYFAHNSPEGVDVGQLVNTSGYQYIIIGENLALGNFLDDETLVKAWMDSPGHRENILNSRYREIGVAVVKGSYQGKITWMAVQHFGKPLSDCPSVDKTLESTIEANKNRLINWEKELENRLDSLKSNPPEDENIFNQQVSEYNQSVAEYNKLVEETKNLIQQYNNQVNQLNQCISGS